MTRHKLGRQPLTALFVIREKGGNLKLGWGRSRVSGRGRGWGRVRGRGRGRGNYVELVCRVQIRICIRYYTFDLHIHLKKMFT